VGTLLVLLGSLLGYRFTTQTYAQRERRRAHIILQTLYALEVAHFQEKGTYLRVDRGTNTEPLKLQLEGAFVYRVVVAGASFAAFAEGDLDGDGDLEVWRVDPRHPSPVLVHRD